MVVYIILTIVKVLIMLTGFGFSFYYFMLYRKGISTLKKVLWMFLSTWAMVIVITAIEFAIAFNK